MYDLIVLGGGSGGLNVASAAAAIGARVALVEKHKLGGECTHTACVPSKALIEAARIARSARRAGEYGLRLGPVEVDFAAVMDRVRSVVESFAGSDSGDSLRAKGIDVYRGSPAFESAGAIRVDDERLQGRKFVIATGSRPAAPAIPGLDEAGYLDNTTVWDLRVRPESLAIVGGGVVGCELGQALARLGVRVTILESGPRLLGAEEPEAGAALRAAFDDEEIAVHVEAKLESVERRGDLRAIRFRVGPADAATTEVVARQILVATGRLANVEGLNLGALGIEADPERGLPVDAYLRTTAANVWAIGDVIGRNRYTHAAEREAAVAFQNALLRIPKRYDDAAMPRCAFTDPEVASVGLSEAQARRERRDVRVLSAEMADVDRPRIDGRTAGLAKVVATPSGRVLGALVVGEGASLVLQEFVLAIEHGLTLGDLAGTVHPYPTVAGVARKLANRFAAKRLDSGLVRGALRWLYGFDPARRGG